MRDDLTLPPPELPPGMPIKRITRAEALEMYPPVAPCFHPDAVWQTLGDGTPVEFCPECGQNIIHRGIAAAIRGSETEGKGKEG